VSVSSPDSIALLDLDVSQRQCTWRFNRVDQGLRDLGPLGVERFQAPTLSVDTSRAVKRTLTGLRLLPNALNDVNVIEERLKLTMILQDGTEWTQGVFLYSDVSRFVVSAGIESSALSLVDQLLIVDQQTDTTVSFGPGTSITSAIDTLLADLPISFEMDSSPAAINPSAEAISWPAGTSRLQIVNELATMAGFHDLFFDNDGIGQLHNMPNPELVDEQDVIHYPLGSRTYRGTVTRSTNLLKLPNRFVVVNNGATSTAVFGKYDVPPDAPHSFSHRGFRITEVEDQQGVATNEDAFAAAQALARQWRFPYETVEFTGSPDPRHDTYDVIDFEGDRFLELSWSMPLVEGGGMRHVIRRTYEGAET
jgi:hypothetical protein